ncbi:oligosaccharide flippase family protein [Pseudonocardia humida]|uniref:Oligosaccharide flippase family protein n=1 Tax=Pseudonocardia humida TaxID=2800819 RepID=A0ABT1A5Y6_9PSEU|nr:oligosaccharide flippase family protein [Pseudonocardia humida]MCO1658244.1 oligosaccharide flippase family protein [Pseudonocardia humida]
MSTLGASAARGTLWLGLVNLISKGSQMAVTVVLAAFLTENELGLVTLAVSLANIGQVVQSMGVYDVITRTRRDPDAMAGTIFTASVAIGLVLAVAGVLGSDVIAGLLGAPEAAPLIVLTALSLPFTAAGGVQMGVMHRTLDFKRRMLPDAGSAVTGAAVTVALAGAGVGEYSLAIGVLCTAVLQPLLGVLAGVRIRPRWDRAAAAEAGRWTAVVGPAAVVAILLINVHYPILARSLGADAVGVYSLAFRIAWVPYIMIAVVLGAVAFPVYTRLKQLNAGMSAAVGMFTHLLLVIVGGCYIVALLLADHIVVLGQRWEPAVPVLMLLCAWGLALCVLQTWYEAIRAADKPKWYLALQATHLVLLAVGLSIAAPFGLVPAAIAQASAAIVLLPVAWFALRGAGVAPPVSVMARSLLGPAAGALGCLAVSRGAAAIGLLDDPSSLPVALGLGVALLATYAGVVSLVDRAAVAQMRGLLRNRSESVAE